MRKATIGYIFNQRRLDPEYRKFFRIAKKLKITLVPFNLAEEINEAEIEEKARQCDIIYNDAGDSLTLELSKTLEMLGKKVIEASKIAYYSEDKWLFFLKCKQNNIPTPETILLPMDLKSAKKELGHFGCWPVILKRIYGEHGQFVERANNADEAIKIIKHFWKKGNERLPIIAQEYINSPSYRVTIINSKIVQTALKRRSGWKATGCYAERFRKFKIDDILRKIVKKVVKISNIAICGVDLAKKTDGKWLVIEVNAEPSLKMFDCEHNLLIAETLKFLKKSI